MKMQLEVIFFFHSQNAEWLHFQEVNDVTHNLLFLWVILSVFVLRIRIVLLVRKTAFNTKST